MSLLIRHYTIRFWGIGEIGYHGALARHYSEFESRILHQKLDQIYFWSFFIKQTMYMKVTLEKIEGEIVKDNEKYVLEDNNTLEHLTLSRTVLKPGMSTNGHSHESQEEVYIFTKGSGVMVIGENSHSASPNDTFLIPKGKFHRVINLSENETCEFTCIFEKYDRNGTEAKY